MAEIINEKEIEEVSGGCWPGKSKGAILGTETFKGVFCYKYRVGSGDNLWQLAMDFGLKGDFQKIADLNGIPDASKISINQIIFIPKVI